MNLRNTYSSIPSGNASSTSPSTHSNRRNKSRLMTILCIQAMVAASYFLLFSPADDLTDADQHRSLAELAKDEQNNRRMSLSDSSFLSGWGEWPTWGPVQNTFRRLCTQDDPRTATYRRSLSLETVDKLIPGFVTEYMSNGEKDNRFSRFLACNVGFNCTYGE